MLAVVLFGSGERLATLMTDTSSVLRQRPGWGGGEQLGRGWAGDAGEAEGWSARATCQRPVEGWPKGLAAGCPAPLPFGWREIQEKSWPVHTLAVSSLPPSWSVSRLRGGDPAGDFRWPAGDLGCAVWLGETWCASAAQATDLPRRDPQELPMQDRRSRSCLLAAACAVLALAPLRSVAWLSPAACRRQLFTGLGLGLLPNLPALAEEQVPLGSIPVDMVATAVGEKVTTPNGVIYEPLEMGTSEGGLRNGPPRGGANVVLRYKAHIDGFDGPVFDSSELRGSRKPNKIDAVECRLNVDPSLPNCLFEAVKLMKVGAKGRAVCPPNVSYSEGKVGFDADEQGDVKKVPAGATLYYDLELVRIIKP
ncbi:unnamed protein product [Effrenium voratum]|nr:unnamed protein product [Effrenium voratum]